MYIRGAFLCTNMDLYSPPLLRNSIPRFFCFLALENHHCRIYICIGDFTPTAGSTNLWNSIVVSHYVDYTTKGTEKLHVKTIHPHLAPFCFSVPPLWCRCDPPYPYWPISDTKGLALYPPHLVAVCTTCTVHRHTLIRRYLFGSSHQTAAALLQPIAHIRCLYRRWSKESYFVFSYSI